jgi:hypothetical protein
LIIRAYILNQFIALISSLLQITLVYTEVGRAGFITNEFQIRAIERKRIT